MSYDIELLKDEKIVDVPQHEEGGTYAVGGTTKAHLSVTYNYAPFFYKTLAKESGIRWIYAKQAKDTVERLEKAIAELGTEQDEDYWKPTAGNAGYALSILLKWAKQHPEAVWRGD